MSTMSWLLSSLLNTWASVTDPYMDMNLTPPNIPVVAAKGQDTGLKIVNC